MISFRFFEDLMTAPFGGNRRLSAEMSSGLGGFGGAAIQPKEAVAPTGAPNDVEMQELREFGYMNYDSERRFFVMTEEGIHRLLSAYNSMKRRVHALEEERKQSVPLMFIGERAVNALRRNPKKAEETFLRTEDMVATWVAANGGAGSEVLTMMNEAYEEIMAREAERAEHRWLLEHGGRNISLERGDYNDRSFTQEEHFKG